MRILIAECVPKRLRREFTGHDVHTVVEMGWSGKKNGVLLLLMEAEKFDVFITVDQNLRYQQNLAAARVAVLILITPTNRLADLLPLVPSAQTTLGSIVPGDILEITS